MRDSRAQVAEQQRRIERLVRRWVRDPHVVADLVQETWLTSLRAQRFPAEEGWLRAVVRNLVFSAARRRQQQHPSLSGELAAAGGGPEEVYERRQALERIVAALDLLPETERELLRLRYLEDRRPQDIAELQSVSLETVRTRLKRARKMLRTRAGEADGRRRGSFFAPLLERLRPVLRPRAAAWTGLGATAALCAGALVLSAPPERGEVVLATTPDAADRRTSDDSIALAPTALGEREGSADARSSVAPPPGGTLVVQAVGARDGLPRPDLPVLFEPLDRARRETDTQILSSDAGGTAVRARCAPGRWRVTPLLGDPVDVDVEAGSSHRVVLPIPDGVSLRTETQGPRRELRAWVWVSFPDRPYVGVDRARADGEGVALLSAVDPRSWIGAHRSGYRVANLTPAGHAPETLSFRLRRLRNELTTQVVDERGRPVPGARVRVVESRGPPLFHAADGRWFVHMPRPGEEADDEGRVRFDTILPLGGWLVAEAPGFAPSTFAFSDAAARLPPALVLSPECRLEVLVRGEDGSPAAGVLVEADPGEPFAARRGRTDAEGRLVLEGLPAGTAVCEANAEDGTAHLGHARAELQLEAGARGSWIATLAGDGERVHGLLVDPEGRPLTGWEVSVARPRTGNPQWAQVVSEEARRARTDAEGRFRFEGCGGVRVLRVRPEEAVGPPWCSLDVSSGDGEVRVTVDPSSPPCAVLEGELPKSPSFLGCELMLDSAALDLPLRARPAEDGTFELGPLPPGDYALSALLPGNTVRPLWEGRLARARVSLGALAAEIGSVAVVLRPAEALRKGRPVAVLLRVGPGAPDGPSPRTTFSDDGVLRADGLAPGRYRLQLDVPRHVPPYVILDVEAGGEARARVDLVKGRDHVLRVDANAWDAPPGTALDIVLLGADGEELFGCTERLPESSSVRRGLVLAPGEAYAVEVFCGERRARVDLPDLRRRFIDVVLPADPASGE